LQDSSLNCWDGNNLGTSNIRIGNGSCNWEPAFHKGSSPALYSNLSIRSNAKSLSPEDAYALIQNSPDLVIIDVRTPQEYQGGHLEGALNLDYYSYGFLDSLKSLDKNRTYIVYCRRGVGGEVAVEMMRALGVKEVHNIIGAWLSGHERGRPMIGELI
jgi:rhodanese-related sulfurtransferase